MVEILDNTDKFFDKGNREAGLEKFLMACVCLCVCVFSHLRARLKGKRKELIKFNVSIQMKPQYLTASA